MEPQPDHVQETVHRSGGEMIAITFAAAVAVAMTTLWVGCLMISVLSRISEKQTSRPCLIIVAVYPVLAVSIWMVLGVALCLQKLRDLSRILLIGNRVMLTNGSDNVGEHRRVQPPMQPPQEPIASSSSSSSFGGFWPGGNVPSEADLQVGGESHHQRSEREREVEMSGEAVSDGRGQNA